MEQLIEQHDVVCSQLAQSMERIAELEATLRDIIKTADDFQSEHGLAMGGWETTRALNRARSLFK